jgi:esterase/lipase
MGKTIYILLFACVLFSNVADADQCAKKMGEIRERLSSQTLSEINKFLQKDVAAGVPVDHRSEVSLITDHNNQPLKTPYSVLLIHGLYNSPKEVSELASYFYAQGMNVINARLPGHFEKDESVLKRKIHFEDWLADGRDDLQLAHKLGTKVILAGHSTGGLLLTWLAVESPKDIGAMILMAPAFGVQAMTRAVATLGESLDLEMKTSNGGVVSGHAGVEVTRMTKAFKEWLHFMDSQDSYAATRLADIPVWMANTSADIVISVSEAEKFIEDISEPYDTAARFHYTIPASHLVPHDLMSHSSNPHFDQMTQSISDFLKGDRPDGITP